MTDPRLPADEALREMSKMAMEQATIFFAEMALRMAGEMRVADPDAAITGPEALEAFAGAIRTTNANLYGRPGEGKVS